MEAVLLNSTDLAGWSDSMLIFFGGVGQEYFLGDALHWWSEKHTVSSVWVVSPFVMIRFEQGSEFGWCQPDPSIMKFSVSLSLNGETLSWIYIPYVLMESFMKNFLPPAPWLSSTIWNTVCTGKARKMLNIIFLCFQTGVVSLTPNFQNNHESFCLFV